MGQPGAANPMLGMMGMPPAALMGGMGMAGMANAGMMGMPGMAGMAGLRPGMGKQLDALLSGWSQTVPHLDALVFDGFRQGGVAEL